MRKIFKNHAIILLGSIFFCVSCSSFQEIKLTDSIEGKIKENDNVRIQKKDGWTRDFVVTSVTPNKIEGKDVSVGVKEIKTLEQKKFSPLKTALLTGAASLAFGAGTTIAAPVFLGSFVVYSIFN